MLYACTCNLALALTPHPPSRPPPPPADGGRQEGSAVEAAAAPSFGTLSFDPAFREAAYEDIDLCLRAVKPPYNLPLTFEPTAETGHRFATWPLGVASQFCRYGRHERAFARKHPTYLARLASSVAVVARGGGSPPPPR